MGQDFAIPSGLERVAVPPEAGDLPVPRFVDCFIRDAEDRAEGYGDRAGKGLFVPGDGRYAFQILQWLLRTKAVCPGAAFLEWGSGQGMATILAALLGYDAVGVEIDAELVKESRELAARYDVKARFEHGTYDASRPGLKVVAARRRAEAAGGSSATSRSWRIVLALPFSAFFSAFRIVLIRPSPPRRRRRAAAPPCLPPRS